MATPATVLLLDTSGSMKEPFPGTRVTKYDFAKATLASELPVLVRTKVPFGLKQFDGRGGIETLLPLGYHNEGATNDALARIIAPKGSSPLPEGISLAAQELSRWDGDDLHPSELSRSILAITDGGNAPNGRPMASLESAYKEVASAAWSGQALRLFLMGLGKFSSSQAAQFGRGAAATGGGFYPISLEADGTEQHLEAKREASTLIQLVAAPRNFEKFLDQLATANLRTVELEWRYSDLTEQVQKWHQLSLEVSDIWETVNRRELLSEARLDEQDTRLRSLSQLLVQVEKEPQRNWLNSFNTPLAWTIASTLAVFAAIGISALERNAARDATLHDELSEVAETVRRLWEIWGQ